MHARSDEGLPDSLRTPFLSQNEAGGVCDSKKSKKNNADHLTGQQTSPDVGIEPTTNISYFYI